MATSPAKTRDRHLMQPLLVRLDDEMRAQVRRAAEDEERSQSQVIRRALRLYFSRQETASA